MSYKFDLENHVSITSSQQVEQILRPLRESFDISFFRYLKLYKSGKRIVLSNIPDAIRYMYGQGNYAHLWYDGEFKEFLKSGWHSWHMNRLLDSREIENKIEDDLTGLLHVYHGITLVHENHDNYEIYSFDSNKKNIYFIDKDLLVRFVYYFKEQAHKLIQIGELDSLVIPIQNITANDDKTQALISFLDNTKINRYYIGTNGDAYVTAKEAVCTRWIIEGKSAEEIALIEGMSIKTVQRHIENIKKKFHLSKQSQIIRLFLHAGLYDKKIDK